MLKKISIFLVAIMIFTAAIYFNMRVTRINYKFKGENESWRAEYRVNGTITFSDKNKKISYDCRSDSTLTVTYKKALSGLSSVKHLEISYEHSAGRGRLTGDFDGNHPVKGTYTLISSNVGGAMVNKDETIKVNINLDGKTQTIELVNTQH